MRKHCMQTTPGMNTDVGLSDGLLRFDLLGSGYMCHAILVPAIFAAVLGLMEGPMDPLNPPAKTKKRAKKPTKS